MNVYQVCSIDLGLLEDNGYGADDLTCGNQIFSKLDRAQAVCQQDDLELKELDDEADELTLLLDWTVSEDGKRWEAESQYNDDVTYVIIKSKVFS